MNEEQSSPICEEEEQAKAGQALQELMDVLNKYKLRTQDLIAVYGNLGYAIGGTIESIDPSQGPSLEELQKRYYARPTLGVALMLQGMLTTSWYDQISQPQADIIASQPRQGEDKE